MISVSMAKFPEEAMIAEPSQEARDLGAAEASEIATQPGVLETCDGPLASRQGLEKLQVVWGEQVEAPGATTMLADRRGQAFDLVQSRGGVRQVGKEVEIALVGRAQQVAENRQAVDGLLHRRELGLARAIVVFHRPVVAKERDIIGRRLDPEDQAVLVIELDGHGSHAVFDPCTLHTGMEIGAKFLGVVAGQLATEEGSYVVGFEGVDGRPDQGLVQGLEVVWMQKDKVGGILDLHEAPVIAVIKLLDDGTVLRRQSIEPLVESLNRKVIGQGLGAIGIAYLGKGVVQRGEADTSPL